MASMCIGSLGSWGVFMVQSRHKTRFASYYAVK
jgi:hypothetical protein